MAKLQDAPPISITYKNWRGETSVRRIVPMAAPHFGQTDWHPEPQWLLRAWDVDKQAEREFALSGFADARACVEAHNAGEEPVAPTAWLIKDYADGWYTVRSEKAAIGAAEDGHAIVPLYAAPQPAADEWRPNESLLLAIMRVRMLVDKSAASQGLIVSVLEQAHEALSAPSGSSPTAPVDAASYTPQRNGKGGIPGEKQHFDCPQCSNIDACGYCEGLDKPGCVEAEPRP